MEKISLPKIREEKLEDNKSRFVIDPLYPGYGATLGNALRRVLLSSIPGSAITSFKLEGAPHEFTAISHVKEDLLEIMLNLKEINVKSDSDEPTALMISKKGPGEVTGADFSKNSSIEIINPEVHIATLDKGAQFELEVTIEKDRGFRSTEDFTDKGKEIGRIDIDAAFSPITRVKMDIENTRVGQMTNYDKLVIEIDSDGSIAPYDALISASNILIDHYKAFAFNEEVPFELTEMPKNEVEIEEEELLGGEEEADEIGLDPKTKIEDANFSQRTTNALVNAGIKTIAGLKRLSDLKLSEIKGLGQKGIDEVKEKLS
ncbi:MAG: DNA-directed RNA polymerase subunit alpha [Patescibacteria group bacterium]|jgi:DNA-directed RNA polymerase subunit alpha